MTAIDLFAGPGGWDTGVLPLGIAPLGVEWDADACATAVAAGHERLQADIAQLDPLDVGGSNLDGLIASPPCQGFSLAGKGDGRRDAARIISAVGDFAAGRDPRDDLATEVKDPRSILALEPLRWALALEPEWTCWEQVPAVLPLWEACAEALRADGYSVWTGNVQAEQYGVPQTRKRAVLIASRNKRVDRPAPTHSQYYPRDKGRLDLGVEKWISMAEALGWGMTQRPSMTVTGGGTATGGAEPFGNAARQGMLREIEAGRWVLRTGVNSAIVGPGERRDALMAEGRWRDCHKPQERDLDAPAPTITSQTSGWKIEPVAAVPGDTSWVYDRPSPTIVGSFAPDVIAAPGYRKAGDPPRQKTPGSVRVTVEEAACLQSFPDRYPWQGTKTAQYRQVGDAVPPGLALHVVAEATGLAIPAAREVAA